MVIWAVVSIAELPPLDRPPPAREGAGLLDILGLVAVALYAYSAWRLAACIDTGAGASCCTWRWPWRSLGEALIAVTVSRNWHPSWWVWHVLLLAAFALIAFGARREYQRADRSPPRSAVCTWRPRSHGSTGGTPAAVASCRRRRGPRRVGRWRAGRPAPRGRLRRRPALLAQTAREVRRLDAAFRPYLPSVVAEGIRERRPDVARLGGEERE